MSGSRMTAPSDLDAILQQISLAHSSPDDESLTESSIIASVSYLQHLPSEIHWLCQSSPLLPVVVQAIQLWGYGEPPARATLSKFKPVLAHALNQCPDCAVEWHTTFRRELKRVFTEVYGYDEVSTSEFYTALQEWDEKRVIEELQNALKVVERIPMAWKHVEVKGPMLECLAAPNLLLRENVLKLWKELFDQLQKLPEEIGDKWLPGALVLIFDGNFHVRNFGERIFKARDTKISVSEFEAGLDRTLTELLTRGVQKINNGSAEMSLILWDAINLILKSSDPTLIKSNLTSPPLNLLQLLLSHLSISGQHFPSLLSALCIFLKILSNVIWQRISISPLALLDQIFSNSTFENILIDPHSLSHPYDMSILLDWIPSLMSTQSSHANVQIVSKILFFLFESFNRPHIIESSRKFCFNEGMRLLNSIVEESVRNDGLVDKDVDLALKLEIIQLVDKYASLIIRNATSGHTRSMRVFGLRLALDCQILEIEMKELIKPDVYRGRIVPSVNLSEMWKVVEKQEWTEDDTDLIKNVLSALCHLPIIDLQGSKNFETKDAERVKKFNNALFDVQKIATSTFSKLSDIRPRVIRTILEDDEACMSAVTNLFNGKRQNLEKADLDMLKTAYDVSGKTDLWNQLLRLRFEPALTGACRIMQEVLLIQRISPPDKLRSWHRGYLLAYTDKIIRQSTQIVEILCSGRSGVLTTTDLLSQSDSYRTTLQKFWRSFWEILNISFISAISWAENEDKNVMKNFLRDVLEGASTLFDSLKIIDASISGVDYDGTSPVKATNIQQQLLKDVQTPLQSLAKWLALNVDDLRETTLILASRILKRFAKAEIRVRQDTLVQYYRLAHGKKKNNMSEEQRTRLLFVLSEHDVDPATRKALETMAATRSAGTITPPLAIDNSTPESSKSTRRDVIDLSSDTEFVSDYLSDSELARMMDRFEKTSSQKPTSLKQTKLDFTKGAVRPPGSTLRTIVQPIKKPVIPIQREPSRQPALPPGQASLAQLKADFKTERIKVPINKKSHKAPVAPPQTDGFGRPIEATSHVPERPRSAPPKKVEESSSSESESDDQEGGLFSIAQENKSPPKIRKVQKRTKVQLLGEPIRSRISLQAQDRRFQRVPSERNMRARLEPDLTPLLKTVLSWNPSHTGDFPPGTKQSDFKKVASTFSSPSKYDETFEPLLTLECWQHIQQARNEQLGDWFDFVIENRTKVDEYVEVYVTMVTTTYTDVSLLDPDLVILSNRKGTLGKACFAKVQGVKKKKDTVELALRCIPSTEVAAILVPKTTMFGVKLFRSVTPFNYAKFSLTPIMREYGALKGLPYYDLVEEILAARPSMPVSPSRHELKFTMDTYAVNEPQAAAIVGACQNQGFSLIQGPPGTGKTKTILGMVGAFLTGNAKPGSMSIMVPGQQPTAPPAKPRLLLCAPSNAAVDEIVLRLLGGIRNAEGEIYHPKIVRVGRSDRINPGVRAVTLDELVDKQLGQSTSTSDKDAQEEQRLLSELHKVLDLRNAKGAEYDKARELGDSKASSLADQLRDLNAQKNRIGAQLDEQREKRLALGRDTDINRRQITASILDEADIICCTLSGSGHDQLAKMKVNFETVIIDEAAQSVELASLIPLKYGCQRCILVGDPNQLPPTVLSQAAAKFQYEESLFVRMQRNHPKSVYLLSIQYRMNPEISRFPSAKFYEGKLIDGTNMASITTREWHSSPLFRPYFFYNVEAGTQERGKRGVSLMNTSEASIALSIYNRLLTEYSHLDFTGKIGIVTPYKEQLRELLRQFRREYGQEITNSLDFNTIDGFQGQEKDIIILSCVRALADGGVGFLKDVRRINVALTRAKSTLLILGNKNALKGNEFWKDLIEDAETRGLIMDCGPRTFVGSSVPVVKASGVKQVTPKGPKSMVKGKMAPQVVGELIPLGPKNQGSMKKTPIIIDVDVEMKDADGDSDDSLEEGEIKDVEMTDAYPETSTKSDAAPPAGPRASITGKQSKKKHATSNGSSTATTEKKFHKTTEGGVQGKRKLSHGSDSAVSPTISRGQPHKRPTPAQVNNPPVIKRKSAPASVFIQSKKPAAKSGDIGPVPSEKKESVKQRLARQMRPPT